MVWMAVTPDEYELPIAVSETYTGLADILGVKPQTIRVKEYKDRQHKDRDPRGRQTKYLIVKVDV